MTKKLNEGRIIQTCKNPIFEGEIKAQLTIQLKEAAS